MKATHKPGGSEKCDFCPKQQCVRIEATNEKEEPIILTACTEHVYLLRNLLRGDSKAFEVYRAHHHNRERDLHDNNCRDGG
jgi:hypothetical protein